MDPESKMQAAGCEYPERQYWEAMLKRTNKHLHKCPPHDIHWAGNLPDADGWMR